jgi:hypothetical protein
MKRHTATALILITIVTALITGCALLPELPNGCRPEGVVGFTCPWELRDSNSPVTPGPVSQNQAQLGPSVANADVTPPALEYKVPLLLATGQWDEITVEDNQPEKGVRIIFCKELEKRRGIFCLANENGHAAYLTIPAGDPRDAT